MVGKGEVALPGGLARLPRSVPLLAPDARAADLDDLLEIAERSGARVDFETLEGGTPERAAELVRRAGVALSLAPVEPPALLAALAARVRCHVSGALPALFTEPGSATGFERGAGQTARVIEAINAALSGAALPGLALPAVPPEAGLCLAATTSSGAAAIVQAAFEHARASGERGIAVVHGASARPATDGLFLHAARNVAVRHTDLQFEDLTLEAFARRAVRDRASFRVLAGPAAAADAALDLLAAVADVPRPAGVVLGRDGERLYGRHGAGGGQVALFIAAQALFAHVGLELAASRLGRALEEGALHRDFAREPAPILAAILARG